MPLIVAAGARLLLDVYGGKIPAHREVSHEKAIQQRIMQGVVFGVHFTSQMASVRLFLLLADRDGHPGQHILVPSLVWEEGWLLESHSRFGDTGFSRLARQK